MVDRGGKSLYSDYSTGLIWYFGVAWGNGSSDPQVIANRLGWGRESYYQVGTPIALALAAQAFIPIMISSFLRHRSLRKGISAGEEKPHTLEYWRKLFLGSPYPFGEIQAKMDYFIFFGIAMTGVPLVTVITSLFFGALTLFASKHFSESKQIQASPSIRLSTGTVWWGYTAVLARLIVSLLSLSDTWLAGISTNLIGSSMSLAVDKWNAMIVHQGLLALWILLGLVQLVWYVVKSLSQSSHAFEEEQLEWCQQHAEKDELADNLPAHTDKLRLLAVDTYSIFRNPEWAVYLKPHFQDEYPDEEPDKQIINLPGQKGADREKTEVNGEGLNKLPAKSKQNAILPYKLIKARDADGTEQPLRNQESKEPNGFTGFVKKIEVSEREKGRGPVVGGANNLQNSKLTGAYGEGNQGKNDPYQKGLNEGQSSSNTLPNQGKSKNQQNLKQVPGQQSNQARLQQQPQTGQQQQQNQQTNGRAGFPGPRGFNPSGQQDYGGQERGGRPRLQSNNRVQIAGGPYQRNAEGLLSRQDISGPSGKSTSRNPLVNRPIKNSAFDDDSSFPQLPLYQGEQTPAGLEGNTSQRYGRPGKPGPNQQSLSSASNQLHIKQFIILISKGLSPSKPFFASALRDGSGPIPPGYRSVKELGLFKPFENRLYGVSMRVDQELEPEENPAFLPGPEEDADFDAALNYRLAMQSAR